MDLHWLGLQHKTSSNWADKPTAMSGLLMWRLDSPVTEITKMFFPRTLKKVSLEGLSPCL